MLIAEDTKSFYTCTRTTNNTPTRRNTPKPITQDYQDSEEEDDWQEEEEEVRKILLEVVD